MVKVTKKRKMARRLVEMRHITVITSVPSHSLLTALLIAVWSVNNNRALVRASKLKTLTVRFQKVVAANPLLGRFSVWCGHLVQGQTSLPFNSHDCLIQWDAKQHGLKRKASLKVYLLKTLWEENTQGRMLFFTVTADWLLLQMESCFWFSVIRGSCLTNTWLIFLLSTLLPMNSGMCWLSGWCAFGFSLNPATPFKQRLTQLFTCSNVPWAIVGNTPLWCYQFNCGWMILNVALLRGSVEGEQTHKTLPASPLLPAH